MSWWIVKHTTFTEEGFSISEDGEKDFSFQVEEEYSPIEEDIHVLGIFNDFEVAYECAFEYAAAKGFEEKDTEKVSFYGTYYKNKISFTINSEYNEDENIFVNDLIEIERIEEKKNG